MGLPKLRDWYSMDHEARKEWDKNNGLVEDMEYDHRRAVEDAERSAERQRRASQAALAGLREDYSMISEELGTVREALEQAEQFIEAKGLTVEYQAWKPVQPQPSEIPDFETVMQEPAEG